LRTGQLTPNPGCGRSASDRERVGDFTLPILTGSVCTVKSTSRMSDERLAALAVIFLLGLSSNAASQRCSDIGSVDFGNSTIQLKQSAEVLDSEFRFQNGVFNKMEEPPGSVSWRFEIIRDTIIRPDPNTAIRFVGIFGNHLTGTGSRDYLIGFRCSGGIVKNVFQQAGEGMRVISLSPHSLQLRFGVWKEADAHCCPSSEKNVRFTWDAGSGTYIEARSSKQAPLIEGPSGSPMK
jgi:hypothetical protein